MACQKGYKLTKERSQAHREKISQHRKQAVLDNNFARLVSCPHCGFLGQEIIMQRWHFDACAYRWLAKSTRLHGKKL